MKNYNVYAKVVGSKWIGVIEAENEEEAIQIGVHHENCYVSLCHQCASECDDLEVTGVFANPVDD